MMWTVCQRQWKYLNLKRMHIQVESFIQQEYAIQTSLKVR